MNREVHVRFWERAEVKFLRANSTKAPAPIGPEPEPMSAPLPKATLIQRIRHPAHHVVLT